MKHLLLTTIAAVLFVGCGESPKDIWEAAKQGNLEAVKQHLADGADVNSKNKSGYTPLHFAAYKGHKEIVELLIAEGADVNAKDDMGRTPFHIAIYGRQNEIVELLIAEGADVNAKDDNSDTPLDEAIIYNSPETAGLLRKHGGKHGTIHMAAKAGDAEAVKEFLAAGTDVKRDDPFTPLHWAALHGHKEIAELLITNGADVNATTAWGSTPLHKAAQNGHKEIVELLIAKGADVNAKDNRLRKTPLDVAIMRKHAEIADLLRKHGGKTKKELEAGN